MILLELITWLCYCGICGRQTPHFERGCMACRSRGAALVEMGAMAARMEARYFAPEPPFGALAISDEDQADIVFLEVKLRYTRDQEILRRIELPSDRKRWEREAEASQADASTRLRHRCRIAVAVLTGLGLLYLVVRMLIY